MDVTQTVSTQKADEEFQTKMNICSNGLLSVGKLLTLHDKITTSTVQSEDIYSVLDDALKSIEELDNNKKAEALIISSCIETAVKCIEFLLKATPSNERLLDYKAKYNAAVVPSKDDR